MPVPLRLRNYVGHDTAAQEIRLAAEGDKRKRRKTRKHKKKAPEKNQTPKTQKKNK